ncbi:PiggyBac transposable element-derived protein 3 [Chionoecetes opilio]|uniref:PiggyBac transposable element-derived protein 3 n=1 Tax=Chionoecetes opilio TaxID=41210 RepID=A0A8J5BZS2_CHIOP|nr:PiggyBac transposable element-derived protein 3 [Chionoecetes opilio]
MVLYQGKTTLEAHGVLLTPKQEAMGSTSKIVSVLASTMSCSTNTAIFADNFFTSLEIVRYLKDMNCRWKDSRVVTLLSTDMGVYPMSSVSRYCSDTKKKEDVSCHALIKSYNANMGGIDKSDMLVQLYRTPMKAKRWYMRLFPYAIDLSITNAWLIYRRDCKALAETGLPLKNFRIQVFRGASSQRAATSRPRRSFAAPGILNITIDVPTPVRGHRSHIPDNSVRFDLTLFHVPIYTSRQTCKFCSKKEHTLISNVLCSVCKVHLCLNAERNCFIKYHERVA